MLRELLRDAAIAAAKKYSHPTVESRHVLFAIAKRFRDLPEVEALLPLARQALEPRGMSDQVPEVSAEAAALLDAITSPAEAQAALRAGFPDAAAPKAPPESAVAATQPDPAIEPLSAPKAPAPRESTAAVLAELDALIGLDSVKAQVKRVIAVVQANAERVKAGLLPVSPGLHLVFTGPPGTGKTTVARLVARLYASTGALPGGNFTEAGRADMIAGYVGQTALKTAELIERTRPGVLFIDEAYSLTPTHPADFGAEALATLVKAMEDHREDFAVIVAGYGDEMAEFIGANPGLRSRFKTIIHFPDYTPPELTQIFASFAKDSGIALDDGVLTKAEAIFRQTQGATHLGNARFARSLFEEAYARMSIRAAADGTMELTELSAIAPEDIEWRGGPIQRETRRVGFGRDQPS